MLQRNFFIDGTVCGEKKVKLPQLPSSDKDSLEESKCDEDGPQIQVIKVVSDEEAVQKMCGAEIVKEVEVEVHEVFSPPRVVQADEAASYEPGDVIDLTNCNVNLASKDSKGDVGQIIDLTQSPVSPHSPDLHLKLPEDDSLEAAEVIDVSAGDVRKPAELLILSQNAVVKMNSAQPPTEPRTPSEVDDSPASPSVSESEKFLPDWYRISLWIRWLGRSMTVSCMVSKAC